MTFSITLNDFIGNLEQGRLTEHFVREEFACGDGCGFDTVDFMTMLVLHFIRQEFGRVKVTSAARCGKYNAAVGGSVKSQHVLGRAVDIVPLDAELQEVYDWLEDNFHGLLAIGLYLSDGFIHIDTRGQCARWVG